MKSLTRKYSDWFGEGDTNKDVAEAIKEFGTPRRTFYSRGGVYMAALVYDDKVVCVGYDGNEYTHHFVMDEEDG